MPREKKVKVEKADLHVGLSGIIPSTQEAFNQKHGDEGITRKTEKESKLKFALELDVVLSREVGKGRAFPTSGQLQVTVIQFFASEKQCNSRDVDNMAKTVLDLLKGKVYKDDSQVMSLVVSKELISRVAQDFIYIYIAIKVLGASGSTEVLKVAGIERAITLYQTLKATGTV